MIVALIPVNPRHQIAEICAMILTGSLVVLSSVGPGEFLRVACWNVHVATRIFIERARDVDLQAERS